MFVLIPPLPLGARKRNMHKALLVPELLLIIFNYVVDDATGRPFLPTLATVARTCQLFQRVAVELLWYELHELSALYNILPSQVRNKESQTWSLNRRMFSGFEWTRFVDRASRVRVLDETASTVYPCNERRIFLAIAALRDCPVLTPNLHTLKWRTTDPHVSTAINLFLSPSLRSLEVDVKHLVNRVVRLPLGDICPKLEDLRITGNGRSASGSISGILRGLHCLKTLVCSTIDNDAFVHLAQLKRLSCLTVDMRWSKLRLDVLRDRLRPDSFENLHTLHWKDYNLELLTEIFLLPDITPSNIHLEIESYCTSPSLNAFLHSFAARFPHVREFSLIHDVMANRRFGLRVGMPGREHQLDACDLKAIFALKSLRVLNLVSLGDLQLDDDLARTIASALPQLEQLRLETDATGPTASSVTFDGLLSLLQHCPKLQSIGLCFDPENMLSFGDTTVRHERVTHLRFGGSIPRSRRVEVDEMLRRVLPSLRTVEECVDGVRWSIRDVYSASDEDRATRALVRNGLSAGRRRRRVTAANEVRRNLLVR